MNKRPIRRTVVSLFARGTTASFLVFIMALAACGQGQRHGVSAELALDQNIFMADEDIEVKVRVTNRSGQPLALGEGNEWATFSIQGANNFPATKLGEMPTAGPFTLGSGMVATRKFNPTPYFDIRTPGRYTITANIHIPQWNQTITCKPVPFTIVNGSPLAGMAGLEFGMPTAPGATNAAPETRRYALLKVAYQEELKLYFRLTDNTGKTLRCYPVGRMLSFSSPETQVDHFNNLHLLWQTGAREFTYLVFMPDGNLLLRQTHVYTESRPRLKASENGNIAVEGGVRRYSAQDLPAASGEAAQK